MLIQIQTKEKSHDTGNAIDALLECHERIRYFMRLAQRIAAGGSPDAEISDAAGKVHRYFSEALPLHSADEDLSLMPRLNTHTAQLSDELSQMEQQHVQIESLLEDLRPLWLEISHDATSHNKHRAALVALTMHLQSLWDVHLEMEERLIFPAANRFLSAADHESIRSEMQKRRN